MKAGKCGSEVLLTYTRVKKKISLFFFFLNFCNFLKMSIYSMKFEIFNGLIVLFSEPNSTKKFLVICVIGLRSRVITNRLGDRGSIPRRVIPKTQKVLLDATQLNTQH